MCSRRQARETDLISKPYFLKCRSRSVVALQLVSDDCRSSFQSRLIQVQNGPNVPGADIQPSACLGFLRSSCTATWGGGAR